MNLLFPPYSILPLSNPSSYHSTGQAQTYIKLVALAHERVVQQMPIHLGLDEDEVDEEDNEVVLDVLVAEATAVLAHRQPDVVPARRVTGARVLRPQRLHRVPALDADGHGFLALCLCLFVGLFALRFFGCGSGI